MPGQVVDGVQELPGGRVAVTTWQPPGLWGVGPGGEVAELVPGRTLPGAADFSFDRRRGLLLLPALLEDRLLAVPLG